MDQASIFLSCLFACLFGHFISIIDQLLLFVCLRPPAVFGKSKEKRCKALSSIDENVPFFNFFFDADRWVITIRSPSANTSRTTKSHLTARKGVCGGGERKGSRTISLFSGHWRSVHRAVHTSRT